MFKCRWCDEIILAHAVYGGYYFLKLTMISYYTTKWLLLFWMWIQSDVA